MQPPIGIGQQQLDLLLGGLVRLLPDFVPEHDGFHSGAPGNGGVASQDTMQVPQLTPERQHHERRCRKIQSRRSCKTHNPVPTKPVWGWGSGAWGLGKSEESSAIAFSTSGRIDSAAREAVIAFSSPALPSVAMQARYASATLLPHSTERRWHAGDRAPLGGISRHCQIGAVRVTDVPHRAERLRSGCLSSPVFDPHTRWRDTSCQCNFVPASSRRADFPR